MRKLLVVLAACCLVAANQPTKEEAKDDKAALQGTWNVVSIERMGNAEEGGEENLTIVIEGDSLTVKQDDRMMFKGKLKLDPAKKPATLDVEVTEGGPPQFKGKVSQGIYTIEGDTFKWCNCEPGAEDRPKEFSTSDKNNHMLIVAKREKK